MFVYVWFVFIRLLLFIDCLSFVVGNSLLFVCFLRCVLFYVSRVFFFFFFFFFLCLLFVDWCLFDVGCCLWLVVC